MCYMKILKSTPAPCKYTPIWHNPDFQLLNNPLHYHTWAQKGITHFRHLFINNQLIDFRVQNYGIDRHQFLNYSQLKSILKTKMIKNNINDNQLEPLEIIDNIILFRNLITLPLAHWILVYCVY